MTSAACVKRRACCSPFWPVVASIVSSVSCGAPSQPLRDHAAHLGELLHQVLLRVQAARRVDDHDAAPARDAGADRVERHGGRDPSRSAEPTKSACARPAQVSSCSAAAARNVSAAPITTLAPGLVQLVGELADRGRLAGAVDADHENHRGLGAQVERAALERLRRARRRRSSGARRAAPRACAGGRRPTRPRAPARSRPSRARPRRRRSAAPRAAPRRRRRWGRRRAR